MNNTRLINILAAVFAALSIGVGLAQATNQASAPLVAGINGSRCTYSTIGDAVAAAGNSATIYILPGAYNEALGNISKNLTFVPAIAGCGSEDTSANSDTVVIDASGQSSDGTGGLVEVQGFSDLFTTRPRYVTFRHMTLRDGSATNGGVVAATNAGNVTLEDVNIIGGNATNGGGIYASNGSVTLTDDSEVTGNEATNGGGVYGSSSTINLYDVFIGKTDTTGNTASANGGGVYVTNSTIHLTIQGIVQYNDTTNGDGGGIYAENSTITHNIAKIEHNEANGRGGGVFLSGGTFTATGGVLRHNRAFEVTNENDGGALFATSAANVTIDTVLISNNVANDGGGIAVAGGTQLLVTDGSLVADNVAFRNGGGIDADDDGTTVTVSDSVEINTNSSGNSGSAVHANNISLLSLVNATIYSNTGFNTIYAFTVDTVTIQDRKSVV